jgi:hypothetical protein
MRPSSPCSRLRLGTAVPAVTAARCPSSPTPEVRTAQAHGVSPGDLAGADTELEQAMELSQAAVGPAHPALGF